MNWLLLVFTVDISGSALSGSSAVLVTEEQCIASLEAMEPLNRRLRAVCVSPDGQTVELGE